MVILQGDNSYPSVAYMFRWYRECLFFHFFTFRTVWFLSCSYCFVFVPRVQRPQNLSFCQLLLFGVSCLHFTVFCLASSLLDFVRSPSEKWFWTSTATCTFINTAKTSGSWIIHIFEKKMFLAFFGGGGGGGGLEETRKRNARKVSFQKINLFHSGLFFEEIYIYKHS